jgi:uncharacterized protein (TIGR00730 family)
MDKFMKYAVWGFFKRAKSEDSSGIVGDINELLKQVKVELKNGFKLMRSHPKSVSIFGSARFKEGEKYYEKSHQLATKIAKETGYSIVTGGGPGIMEAASCGAAQGGGRSVGLTIKLPREQYTNPCVSEQADFDYFFTRKTILTFSAEAYVFFPGGFGTLDEFFDIITLIQTKKIPSVPIVLFGVDYWMEIHEFIKKHMFQDYHTINEEDMDLYTITDDMDKVVEIIKKAPVRNWWKHYER